MYYKKRQNKANTKFVKIPTIDWTKQSKKIIEKTPKEIFNKVLKWVSEFENDKKINLSEIKEGLRSLGFHKENPEMYKLIEMLCLDCDIKDKSLTAEEFANFIDKNLYDLNSRNGVGRIFDNYCDERKQVITPIEMKKILGDKVSKEQVQKIMETLAGSNKNIDLDAEQFYLIMTKEPSEVEKINMITRTSN